MSAPHSTNHADPHAPAESTVSTVDHVRDMNLPIIFTAIIVTTFLVVSSIVISETIYHWSLESELESKSYARTNEDLRELRAKQTDHLKDYRWVDAKAKTVAIPIDQAMKLVAAERSAAAAKSLEQAPAKPVEAPASKDAEKE